MDRTWTATITVDRSDLNGRSETVAATESYLNLKSDQRRAAVIEAYQYLLAGLGDSAEVQLYKTTKAHGTRKDSWEMVYVEDARRFARKRGDK